MKKTPYALLLTLIGFGTLSAQTWTQVTSATTSNLNAIAFNSDTVGIAVGENSTNVVPINNTGLSWFNLTHPSCYHTSISSVAYPKSSQRIYEVVNLSGGGGQSSILRSLDGGQSFLCSLVPLYDSTNTGLETVVGNIYFIDSLIGFISGYTYDAANYTWGCILKTINGGISWNYVFYDSYYHSAGVAEVLFVNNQVGYALRSNDTLYKSTDGGNTWNGYSSAPGASSIYFYNQNIAWLVGSNGLLRKSVDSGMTWLQVPISTSDNLLKIIFTDSLHGWINGGAHIYHSCDGGATWTISATITSGSNNTPITDICMLNNDLGYAICYGGAIYKFSCPTTNTNITRSICSGESFSLGNESFNATGHYSATLTAINCGCDSIVNLDLTVNPLPNPTVSDNGGVLSTGTFSHYQWLYGTSAIPGDTFQSISPSLPGSYAVIVTDANGCSDTSVGAVYTSIETVDVDAPNISLYPNPTSQSCSILIQGALGGEYDARVIDMTGKEVSSLFTNQSFDKGSFTFPVSQYAKGIYMLKVTNSNGQHVVKKLVVE